MANERRYAIYYTPAPDSALACFGAAVLGYDASTGQDVGRAKLSALLPPGLEALTREPRLYGFHGTLKAPMALRTGVSEADVLAAVSAFAGQRPPVILGELEVALIGGFVALVPAVPCPTIALLAAECVAHFDSFRAPLSDSDRARRVQQGLSLRQTALLDRWGYPYVFNEFRFHMTLTGSLPPQDRDLWLRALQAAFNDLSGDVVVVEAVSVFRQQARNEPFRAIARVVLGA